MDKNAIFKRMALLEKSQAELKMKQEMLSDLISGDEELQELSDRAKAASDKLKAHKEALMNEPEARSLQADIRDLQHEVKDTKSLLTSELLGYLVEEKTLTLKDDNGDEYHLKFSGQAKKAGA